MVFTTCCPLGRPFAPLEAWGPVCFHPCAGHPAGVLLEHQGQDGHADDPCWPGHFASSWGSLHLSPLPQGLACSPRKLLLQEVCCLQGARTQMEHRWYLVCRSHTVLTVRQAGYCLLPAHIQYQSQTHLFSPANEPVIWRGSSACKGELDPYGLLAT